MELARGGFTFVEILIALSLLSFALMGIIGMTSTGFEQTASAEKTLAALDVAKDQMEQLLRAETPSSGDEERSRGIHCTWETLGTISESGPATITVRVSWRGQDREQTMTLQRMVYR